VFSVKVQDVVLFPPLEHAPDQMALLPFETVSVILLPELNEACDELPTAALMPAGLDVTRSPLRPVAETVSVTVAGGGGAGGLTVIVPIAWRPPAVANTVSPVEVVTGEVGTLKLNVCSPAGTVTLGGGLAAALFEDRFTTNPPAGAGFVNPMMPSVVSPPVTVFGKNPKLESAAGPGGGVSVTVADFDELFSDAVMVTGVLVVTAAVVEVNVPLCAPVGIVSDPGTLNSDGLLLVSATVAPGG